MIVKEEETVYIVDTNILVHAVRGDAIWDIIKSRYDLLMHEPCPIYSVVSEGEIRSLAVQWGWGQSRRNQMEFLLGYFVRFSIDDSDLIEAYALIDSYSKTIGLTMGKNDLWIAATAKIAEATLLTTDSDFDRLAPAYLSLERIESVKVNLPALPKITP